MNAILYHYINAILYHIIPLWYLFCSNGIKIISIRGRLAMVECRGEYKSSKIFFYNYETFANKYKI